MKYQLVVMGPSKMKCRESLETEFVDRVRDLGLDPVSHTKVTDGNQQNRITWDGPMVGVWFGGTEDPDQLDIELLKSFVGGERCRIPSR